jgi:ubiquinone/menaquinone biosynthesis C-methylase UbiE
MARAHPIIAAIYERMSESLEREHLGNLRRKLIAAAKGVVLEIGAGTGKNFPYYLPGAAEEVIALEPDPYMRRRGEPRAQAAGVPIRLIDGCAESLPVDDAYADTVVATLVLCSVDDLPKAAQELRRVLKPGGTLVLIEHIRSQERWRARLQDMLTPLWRRIAANCHPNRSTLEVLRDLGFDFRDQEELSVGAPWTQPVVAGLATAP